MLVIGKITSPHGIKGDVRVYPLTDYPDRYFEMKEILVGDEENNTSYKITKVSKHKNIYLFKFDTVNTIDDASALKNKLLVIHEKDAVVLPEDTFYIHDIVGMDVYRADETYLGKVKEIIPTGSNDVYVVKGAEGDLLIPALKAIITIDSAERKITVADLPGLFDNPEEA